MEEKKAGKWDGECWGGGGVAALHSVIRKVSPRRLYFSENVEETKE